MTSKDGDGGPPDETASSRLRSWRVRWPPSPRRLAPGLLIVALLAVPTGLAVRGRIVDARPTSSAGFGGRGLFGADEDAAGNDLDVGDGASVDLDEFLDADLLEAVPVGAEDVAGPLQAILNGADIIDALDDSGIPAVAREAYDEAEAELAAADPSCGVDWSLLAAIGRVESDHGRFGGARLTEDGYGTKPILGIPLDGRPNVALIRDTDGGALDRDRIFDRAVGPMQIIPSTWRGIASDGNGDDRRDPNNIYDAAHGAARYLCAGNRDLRRVADRRLAVRSYNDADEYVEMVLRLATMYATRDIRIVEDAIALEADFDDDDLPVAPLPVVNEAPPPAPAPAPAPAPTAPPTTAAPAPPTEPAAVGWAPATRVVVVLIIKEQEAKSAAPAGPGDPACPTPTTVSPPSPSTTSTTKPPASTTRPAANAKAPCPAPSTTTTTPVGRGGK